ncbi:MAG: hypothetical protein Q7J07_04365 [Pelolinea sp.]|nr:hypothetical protein [Pelolinea sp.]
MPSVMGVKGPIAESDLGLTLPHEHLFVDLSCYCPSEPQNEVGKEFYHREVSLSIRDQVVDHPWDIVDNTRLNNLSTAIEEVLLYAALGGKTITDLSCCTAMGRLPEGLLKVAENTGINVIMSCGRYTLPSMTEQDRRMSVADVEAQIFNEFINGANGIMPGLLKSGFTSKIDHDAEICTLRAVGRVQCRVGCAVAIHPYIWESESHLILDILEEEGCDLKRVILCHQDYLGIKSDYLNSLCKRGAYLEFDTFGCGWINDAMWQQTDAVKIGFLKEQVKLGNADHLLISGDICLKIMLATWGGTGYAHIPKTLIPAMRTAGFSNDLIHLLTVENPSRVYCH